MKQFSLEEYLANPAKKVVTRSGKDVRILCTDAKGDFPIIALIDELTDNCIYHSVYTKEGHVKPYIYLPVMTFSLLLKSTKVGLKGLVSCKFNVSNRQR